MNLGKHLMMIKGEHSLSDVWNYFLANFRYWAYYSDFRFLIRSHIAEQYELRIRLMDQQCLNEGSCKKCGCETTNLQFSNKPCEGNCYPSMMDSFKWKVFKGGLDNCKNCKHSKFIGYYTDISTGLIWFNRNKIETPLRDKELISHETDTYTYRFRRDNC